MSTLTPHQKAALDFQNHISLTANAGSGKTLVLSTRYLEIALSENISLRNIAAITFTEKAASELYRKITLQIEDKIAGNSNLSEVKKLENIRRQLVSANISTIHSFCIDILREFPVESGLDANFSPIDERLSDELIELSVEEVIRKSLETPEEEGDIKYLIRIFASKKLFARDLTALIKNRKNVLSLADELYVKTEEEIARHFYNNFEELFTGIFLRDKKSLIKNITEINNNVLSGKKTNEKALIIKSLLDKLETEKDTLALLKLIQEIKLNICTNESGIRISGYLKKENRSVIESACKSVENYFKGLPSIDMENHEEVELELAHFGKKIIFFFNKVLENYNSRKKESGYLDYEDILLFTQKILQDENVKAELHNKFRYIMIDEYQDTNEIQYRIFLPILDYLKRGNLFVVGDEKQSIYMFRDAELEIFDLTRNDIKNQSGADKLLQLPDSFRMAPLLCVFTNYVFKNLFSNYNTLYNEVEHSDLVCAREEGPEGNVEILLAGRGENAGENAEAELVVKKILKLKNENPDFKWSDAAILCRRRKAFTELEKAFVKYRIPFIIMGGKGFYQKQLVYDIYNYFSFLMDPQNDTALVGVLRSPFFTISDAEIFSISLQKDRSFWHKLVSASSYKPGLLNIVESLRENISLTNNLDTTALLRKVLKESNYLAILASQKNGDQDLANLEKLVGYTINFNSKSFNTLYDYVNYLKESIEEIEDEEQAPISDESESVKIMTLHQAKGLEYPVVFLYKCDESSRSNTTRSKAVQVNKKYGLLTKVPLNQDYFNEYKTAPVIGLSDFISDKKNIAENKRLFYVGVTRAKDHLFLSAAYKEEFNYSKDSFMGLLQEALNNELRDEVTIYSDLKFLKKNEESYFNITENKKLTIPIVYDVTDFYIEEKKIPEYEVKNLLIQNITDKPEGEVVSATKVAVYQQCPLKYKLTYELGFQELYSGYKNRVSEEKSGSMYEFNMLEDETASAEEEVSGGELINFSDLKGRIIHSVLQKKITPDDLEEFVTMSVNEGLSRVNSAGKKIYSAEEINPAELIKDILNDLNNFYKSKIFYDINNYDNYKNEFEIYVKENDYYLYGIIDKLIINNNSAIIIDYKTGDVSLEQISERASSYLTQLKFYAYIVSRYLNNIDHFELKLLFIKHPGNAITEIIVKEQLNSIKEEISGMVLNIRNSYYTKNTEHCRKCIYSINFSKCIVHDSV